MDLIGLILVAAIIYGIVRWTRGGRMSGIRRTGSRRFKCHDCAHRRRQFDDGVMCGYGNREVFKNARHIAMCGDWTPRG